MAERTLFFGSPTAATLQRALGLADSDLLRVTGAFTTADLPTLRAAHCALGNDRFARGFVIMGVLVLPESAERLGPMIDYAALAARVPIVHIGRMLLGCPPCARRQLVWLSKLSPADLAAYARRYAESWRPDMPLTPTARRWVLALLGGLARRAPPMAWWLRQRLVGALLTVV